MKSKRLISTVSAFVLLLYCTAVIGFDVHSCSLTGSSFVVSLLRGTSCEDIHPVSSHANHCHCCHSRSEAHHCCHDTRCAHAYTDDCCSDDCYLLALTGVDRHSEDRLADLSPVPAFLTGLVPAASVSVNLGRSATDSHDYGPGQHGRQSGGQSVFCIWRI